MGNPFHGETITQVSSSIYNLAGDTSKLKSFIKKTIFQSVFLVDETNIAKSISSSILNSHGFNLRHYIYWLSHGYNGKRYKELAGYQSSEVGLGTGLNPKNIETVLFQSVRETLPEGVDTSSDPTKDPCVYIVDSDFGSSVPSWWAGIYIEKYATQYRNTAFTVTMGDIYLDDNQEEKQIMHIEFNIDPAESIDVVLPYEDLPLCRPNVKYIYASYIVYWANDPEGRNMDADYYAAYTEYEIAYADWVNTAPDGTPAPTEPPSPIENLYELKEQYQSQEDLLDTQSHPREHYVWEPSDIQYFIYEQGSNKDASFETLFENEIINIPFDYSYFVPPIPFRLNNLNLSEIFTPESKLKENVREKVQRFKRHNNMTEISDLYRLSKRAFSKAYKVNGYKELDKVILENDNLGDIDYAYLFFGVSLNTLSPEGKEYLYKFFKNLHDLTSTSLSSTNEIYVKANKHPLNFSYRILWDDSVFFSGVQAKKEHAFLKDVKFDKNKQYAYDYTRKKVEVKRRITQDNEQQDITVPVIKENYTYFIKKNKNGTYDYVRFKGLLHKNYVYDYDEVTTSDEDAFRKINKDWKEGDEWEESPFIVPIHMGIFRSLSPLAQAELGEVSAYMIFNCYERKRLKWYQTKSFSSFFQWLGVVLAVATWGYSSYMNAAATAENAASTGVAVATTETIAKTAMSMIIKAAIAFAAAKIIIKTLTPLIGTKAATLIGTVIASIASMSYGANSFSEIFEALTQAPNLIMLGLSTLDGYMKGMSAEAQENLALAQQNALETQNKMQELQRQYAGLMGDTDMWANESFWFRLRTELSPDGYFHFTLPRGAEIAERTLDWTVNYPEYSTRTYLAI